MDENVCSECGYVGEPTEESLCPECGALLFTSEMAEMIASAEAEGDGEGDEAIVYGDDIAEATDEEKAAQKKRATKYGIEIRKDGNVTKPKAYSNVQDADFADPVNYAYPMDTYDRAVAALRYWGKPANRAKYGTKSQSIITRRMNTLAKKRGVKTAKTKKESWEILAAELEQVKDLDAAETVLAEASSLPESEHVAALVEGARVKVSELMADGREALSDEFDGNVEILERSDGVVRFRAIVMQVDTVNKNGRLYPRKEIVKNLARVNKMAQAGGFVGYDGHPSFFGGGGTARALAVKFDKLMLRGKDLHAEGRIVWTGAGRAVSGCWEAGVGLEWSVRGYGKPKEVLKKDGSFSHTVIEDYILDGVDIVDRGAADTKTLQVTKESLGDKPEGTEVNDKDAIQENVQPDAAPATPPAPVADAAPPAPVVDLDAIRKAATEAAAEGARAVIAEDKLNAYKAAKLAGLDDKARPVLTRALADAKTTEDVDAVMAEFQPLLAQVFDAKKLSGVGFVTERAATKERVEKWYLGGNLVDRPQTAAEAKFQLLESIEDNGKPLSSGMPWNNPRKVFEKILENVEREHPEYFWACTKQGIQEAATTTTALSPILPYVLPMLRQLFPMLIPYRIAAVQPLPAPTGRVYWLNFQTAAGVDLSDSSTFDSTWADHTEEATKSQITLDLDYTDVTTTERSLYYQVTSALIQDLRSLHNLDAEPELIRAATDEIAREINMTFLEMLRTGATAGNLTYGGKNYDTLGYNGQEWNDRLTHFFAVAGGYVSQKVYIQPDWVVCGPGIAPLIKSVRGYTSDRMEQLGTGLRLVGHVTDYDVYEAAWFSPYVALLGYTPPSWEKAAAVYAPYIPLYLSPSDYDASKNIAKRSVTTRAAMSILRANGYATITYNAGTDASEPSTMPT